MNTEKQIEFDKVKEIWAGFAVTEYAKDKIKDAQIILNETALRKELRDTTNSRKMIEELGIPSFFVLYERFPLLATGKVDMMALKKDAQERVKIQN